MPKNNVPAIIKRDAARLNSNESPVNFLGDKINNNATLRKMLQETWKTSTNIQSEVIQNPNEKYYRIIELGA